jgi:hypothetical protein
MSARRHFYTGHFQFLPNHSAVPKRTARKDRAKPRAKTARVQNIFNYHTRPQGATMRCPESVENAPKCRRADILGFVGLAF